MKKSKASFLPVWIGLLFFCNPVVKLYDILPDTVGALLIFCGLKKWADVDGYFEDARRLSLYMIPVFLIKIALSFTLPASPDNALPYTFIFGVLELILFLPFFSKLFAGFEYTAMRRGVPEIAERKKDTLTLCLVFSVVRCVLTFLPETFTFLRQSEELSLSAGTSSVLPASYLYPYAVVLCVTVTLILGIVCAVRLLVFAGVVKKSDAYRVSLADDYAESRLVYRDRYVNRALSLSFLLLAVSALFLPDVTVDGVNFLPTFLVPLIMGASFLPFGRVLPERKLPLIPLISLLVLSAADVCFDLLTGKTVFLLLQGDRARLTDTPVFTFLSSGHASVIHGVLLLLEGIALFFVLYAYIRLVKTAFSAEKRGNFDRSLLSVTLCCLLTFFARAVAAVARTRSAYFAADESVAAYLDARIRLSAQAMHQALVENTAVGAFDTADSVAFYARIAVFVLLAFTVINVLSLRAKTVKEEL